MASDRAGNLFHTLHRWASQQDENFVTDAFALVLRSLADQNEKAFGNLLSKLTGGRFDVSPTAIPLVTIDTQVSTNHGYPDMRISYPGHCAYVEVKVESEPDQSQLARYRKALLECGEPSTCLVLLTRYPALLNSRLETPDFNPRWYRVTEWLQEALDESQIESPVGQYLATQFILFLQNRSIAMRQLTPDMVAGIRSMRSLMLMIAEALTALGRPFTRPRAIDYIGCYIDDQSFWLGIYLDRPESLVFETYKNFSIDQDKVRNLDNGGQVVPSNWTGNHLKWVKEYELAPGNNELFGVGQSTQFEAIKTFIRECLTDAEQIRSTDTPR